MVHWTAKEIRNNKAKQTRIRNLEETVGASGSRINREEKPQSMLGIYQSLQTMTEQMQKPVQLTWQ